jgi:hypothetical protein
MRWHMQQYTKALVAFRKLAMESKTICKELGQNEGFETSCSDSQ